MCTIFIIDVIEVRKDHVDDKIKILHEIDAKKQKVSCRDVSTAYNIGKTQASDILKNKADLRKEYESFKGECVKHLARKNHQKYKINDTTWYVKCEATDP